MNFPISGQSAAADLPVRSCARNALQRRRGSRETALSPLPCMPFIPLFCSALVGRSGQLSVRSSTSGSGPRSDQFVVVEPFGLLRFDRFV